MRRRRGSSELAPDGADGAGKTIFADELTETLRGLGRSVVRVLVDIYLEPVNDATV